MTDSEPEVTGTEEVSGESYAERGEVLGVLTGQVPVRSMPVAEFVHRKGCGLPSGRTQACACNETLQRGGT